MSKKTKLTNYCPECGRRLQYRYDDHCTGLEAFCRCGWIGKPPVVVLPPSPQEPTP